MGDHGVVGKRYGGFTGNTPGSCYRSLGEGLLTQTRSDFHRSSDLEKQKRINASEIKGN